MPVPQSFDVFIETNGDSGQKRVGLLPNHFMASCASCGNLDGSLSSSRVLMFLFIAKKVRYKRLRTERCKNDIHLAVVCLFPGLFFVCALWGCGTHFGFTWLIACRTYFYTYKDRLWHLAPMQMMIVSRSMCSVSCTAVMLCTVVRVAAVMSDILFIAAMIAWPRETEVTGNYVDMVIYLNSAAGETAGCSCRLMDNWHIRNSSRGGAVMTGAYLITALPVPVPAD